MLLFIFSLPLTAISSNWLEVNSSKTSKTYIDAESIIQTKLADEVYYAKAWSKTVYDRSKSEFFKNGNLLILYKFDCINHKYKILEAAWVDKKGNRPGAKISASEKEIRYKELLPDSPIKKFINFSCSYKTD